MPEPTKDKWIEISKGFEIHAKFPNCIGALDGKHIRMIQHKILVRFIIIINIFFRLFYWHYAMLTIVLLGGTLVLMVRIMTKKFSKNPLYIQN